ncbi:MAG: transcription termination factor Rho, partial [bacterium]|nr:transcription termination factor Rho [bacterium]
MDIAQLKREPVGKLAEIALGLEIEGASSMRKQELIFRIIEAQ